MSSRKRKRASSSAVVKQACNLSGDHHDGHSINFESIVKFLDIELTHYQEPLAWRVGFIRNSSIRDVTIRHRNESHVIDNENWFYLADLKFNGDLRGYNELFHHLNECSLWCDFKKGEVLLELFAKDVRGLRLSVNAVLQPSFNVMLLSKHFFSIIEAKAAQLVYNVESDQNTLVVTIIIGKKLMLQGSPESLEVKRNMTLSYDFVCLLYPAILPPEYSFQFPDVSKSLSNQPVHEQLNESYYQQIFKFYKMVRTHQLTFLNISNNKLNIPHLTAQLLNYQTESLNWLLMKEQAPGFYFNNDSSIHILWREIVIEGHPNLYYSPFIGKFSSEFVCSHPPPKGGILADEMGLGKTVEILSLVLSHPWTGQVNEEINFRKIKDLSSNQDYSDCTACFCDSSMDVNLDGDGVNTVNVLVQCDVCCNWQHSSCVDFDAVNDKDYICYRCLLEKPISCGTTLIILPETLLYQWMEEISKHTDIDSLKIMLYSGVAKSYINPLHIALYDIVLVTYEVIRKELDRVHHHDFMLKLRHRKSYVYSPSPLLAINWWRICLDEAQLVETSTSKAAEMTHRLRAVNRWCVTGTPVQKDLCDMYGLIYFLGYQPYCLSYWWKKLIWEPYCKGNLCPMIELFSKLMWRNSKEDVANEISCPKLTENLYKLKFSAIEAYFYQRQEEICFRTFIEVTKSFTEQNIQLSKFDRSLITKLLAPLHSLRLACCHPQLVKKGYASANSLINHSYLTMDDLLMKMISQAKQEGRETLRNLVAAFNGAAGLYILKHEFEKAVETYRAAMSFWKEHENDYECDRLQRIHTMENLSSLLKDGYSSLSRAISDDCLDETSTCLRSEYLKKHDNQVLKSVNCLCLASYKTRVAHYQVTCLYTEQYPDVERFSSLHSDEDDSVDNDGKIENVFGDDEIQHFTIPLGLYSPVGLWLPSVIQWAIDVGKDKDLYDLVETDMYSSPNCLAYFRFTSLTTFQYSVINYFDRLENERKMILSCIDLLSKSPSPELISSVTNCHLRSIAVMDNSCKFCECQLSLKNYEEKLFSQYHVQSDENGISRSMSVVEKIMNSVLSFVKSEGSSTLLCESGSKVAKYIKFLRKEFKYITMVWIAAEQRLRACDELNMASNRFKIIPSSACNIGSDFAQDPFVLTQDEVIPKLLQSVSDINKFQKALEKNFGQLKYLRNLQSNAESACPICSISLDGDQQNNERAVLPCGHSFCLDCLYTILHRQSPNFSQTRSISQQIEGILSTRATLTCPLCRENFNTDKISYIRPVPADKEISPHLKGNLSTKITGVIGKLLSLSGENFQSKSIVFSSNSEVLNLLSLGLTENNVNHALLLNKRTFHENLKEFKTSVDVNVLLIPMASGSYGLNITEATNVLFVEPSLNIAREIQAISRVHRLGQTRPTSVHRFYITNTIEERISELVRNRCTDMMKYFVSNSSDFESNLTIKELSELLITM